MASAPDRAAGDARAALIPPEILPLFDDRFARSCALVEEHAARLAAAVARATGLADACAAPATVGEALAHAGLAAHVARVPVAWLLATLAARGWADEPEPGRYRVRLPAPLPDPDEILAAQAAHDERCLPSFRIAAFAAARYPAVLRGELTGEQALFDAEGIVAWSKYFSNANPLYAVANAVGAVAAARALRHRAGAVLELGGGLGSGAEALLDRLGPDAIPSYRFTELSALFLRRAERALRARFRDRALEFAALDIDRPFGLAPARFALVYAVNVLHVARDLAATLAEVRAALAPGGALVIAECVRPFAGRPVHVELAFNLLAPFRDPVLVPGWRPRGGFLAPEEWRRALAANGFRAVEVYPDIEAIRAAFPQFVVAAITARCA